MQIVTLILSCSVAIVFFLRWRSRERRHLWYWGAAFSCWALQILVNIAPLNHALAVAAGRTFMAAACLLGIYAGHELRDRKPSLLWLPLLVVALLVSLWAPPFVAGDTVSGVPFYPLVAVLLATTAIQIIGHPRQSVGQYLTAMAFFFGATYALLFPFMTGPAWFQAIEQELDLFGTVAIAGSLYVLDVQLD